MQPSSRRGDSHKGVVRGEEALEGSKSQVGSLALTLRPPEVWKQPRGRMGRRYRRINLVVQKPGGGEAIGLLCSDQVL